MPDPVPLGEHGEQSHARTGLKATAALGKQSGVGVHPWLTGGRDREAGRRGHLLDFPGGPQSFGDTSLKERSGPQHSLLHAEGR